MNKETILQRIKNEELCLTLISEADLWINNLNEKVSDGQTEFYQRFRLEIAIGTETPTKTIIGNMEFIYFNPKAAYEADITYEDAWCYADGSDGALLSALEAVAQVMEKKKFKIDNCPSLCYIDEFYLEPEYRSAGIGKYILKNLHLFLNRMSYYSIFPKFFATVVEPEYGHRRDIPAEEKAKLKEIMEDTVIKAGFRSQMADDRKVFWKMNY